MDEILGFLPFFYLGFWGFWIPQFKFFKNLNMMHRWKQAQDRPELGMWQLTPTKQESRLEIQA